ncbi:hypothetical protein WDW86_11065 [Bdellovibrionota bacterium FG-2]
MVESKRKSKRIVEEDCDDVMRDCERTSVVESQAMLERWKSLNKNVKILGKNELNVLLKEILASKLESCVLPIGDFSRWSNKEVNAAIGNAIKLDGKNPKIRFIYGNPNVELGDLQKNTLICDGFLPTPRGKGVKEGEFTGKDGRKNLLLTLSIGDLTSCLKLRFKAFIKKWVFAFAILMVIFGWIAASVDPTIISIGLNFLWSGLVCAAAYAGCRDVSFKDIPAAFYLGEIRSMFQENLGQSRKDAEEYVSEESLKQNTELLAKLSESPNELGNSSVALAPFIIGQDLLPFGGGAYFDDILVKYPPKLEMIPVASDTIVVSLSILAAEFLISNEQPTPSGRVSKVPRGAKGVNSEYLTVISNIAAITLARSFSVCPSVQKIKVGILTTDYNDYPEEGDEVTAGARVPVLYFDISRANFTQFARNCQRDPFEAIHELQPILSLNEKTNQLCQIEVPDAQWCKCFLIADAA